MENIEEFMESFYGAITFGPGENFPAERFRTLFHPAAVLLERTESGTVSKTLEDHIEEFEAAVRDWPQLFAFGFTERQTALEWQGSDGVWLVRSAYEKRYARDGYPVTETGVNHFTVVETADGPRIACAVW